MRASRTRGPTPAEPETLRPVPDLAGTPVEDVEGRYVGQLYGALAEEESGVIRYLDLALEGTDRHVLIPLGHARIEQADGRPRARLRAATREDLSEIPPYEPHRPKVDGPYQQAVLAAHGRLFHGDRYYAHPAFDHSGLYAGEHPIARGPSAPVSLAPLERLSDLPGYRVREDEPDIRGWPLLDGHGQRVGTVEDLIVDPTARKVRYALVALEEGPKRVLVPVGFLQIQSDATEVRTPALTAEDLRALPPYRLGAVTREDEERIREVLEERLGSGRRFQRPDFHAA